MWYGMVVDSTRIHTQRLSKCRHTRTPQNAQALDFRSPTGLPTPGAGAKDGDAAGAAEAGLLAAVVVVRFLTSGVCVGVKGRRD
jgi:hypothetical protein